MTLGASTMAAQAAAAIAPLAFARKLRRSALTLLTRRRIAPTGGLVSPSVVISISVAAAHRQRERERRADAHLALHPDLSAVQLDKLARERQPEPRAFD